MQIPQSAIVRVRRARWRIVDVRGYDDCRLLTLVGAAPENFGLERRILAPFDIVEPIVRRSRPRLASRRSWRRACRALVAGDTPPGSLRHARLARIDLLPHQLEPALALVRGLGSRVLLADDVGLGKTIQAGLVVCELRARGAGDRVLIVTPAGLRDQWARELADRFDLDATVVDVGALARAAARLPFGANPWQTMSIAVVSADYIKRADVLAAAAACRWDILIVDEAHGLAGSSDRHAAVEALAARTPYVILLTATPHNGDRRAFASLCSLGSTTRTAGDDPLLVFRRSRQDVRLGTLRRVHRLCVRSSPDEHRVRSLLTGYARAVRRERGAGRAVDPDFWLAVALLHKRALSSARALQQSVEHRLAALDPGAPNQESQLPLPLDDSTGELTADDEAPPWPSVLGLRDAARERQMLTALAGAAAAAARQETKIRALGRLLRRVGEPAIVFTEYRDTLVHLRRLVAGDGLVLHGGLTRAERLAAVERFTGGGARVLFATDAAGQGLNLHHASRLVVNLELPWNPMRLEQRIGRVDRIGQRRTVHAFHLIARDRGEATILARLASRVALARQDVGAPDPLGAETPQGVDRQAVARELVTGSGADTRPVDSFDDILAGGRLVTPLLHADAVSEAERRAASRRLSCRGDDHALARVTGSGPLVITARHWRTRCRLGRRALLLWRVAIEDASGRTVDSTLITLSVELAASADGRTELDRLLARGTSDLHAVVETAAAPWRQHAASVHHSFTLRRLERERAIAQAAARLCVPPQTVVANHSLSQPGLFDLRAHHARLAVAEGECSASRARAERMASLERADALSPVEPQLMLALVP